jgi:hypothetical protein
MSTGRAEIRQATAATRLFWLAVVAFYVAFLVYEMVMVGSATKASWSFVLAGAWAGAWLHWSIRMLVMDDA